MEDLNMDEEVISNPQAESSQNANMEDQLLSLFSSQKFIKVLVDKIRGEITPPNISSPSIEDTPSEPNEYNSKSKQLPTFSIPPIDVEDKLKGHSNYRSWKQRVERDLIALGRHDFLKYSLGGDNQDFSHEERRMYDAQVRQYLEATLQNGPRSLIKNEKTAAEAFLKLEQMFGKNDIQKMVELLDNFGKIVLHPKMKPMMFITKFEDTVRQFEELGVPLDKKIIVAYFLHKVRHLRTFSGFYATVATLPENTRTYEFVRNSFLDVASNNYNLELENSKSDNEMINIVCSECNNHSDASCRAVDSDIITICSICLDFPKETILLNNDFVSVSCLHCGKSSTNLCDFCTGSRSEGSSSEPPRKKEKLMAFSTKFVEKKYKGFHYTPEQLEKIKKMSAEEKKTARCNKCGLLFHKASECKSEGRACFYCYKSGHEKKDCKKLQSQKSKS